MAHAPGVMLDGKHLTIEPPVRVARDPKVKIDCEATAKEPIVRAARRIRSIFDEYTRAVNPSDASYPVSHSQSGDGIIEIFVQKASVRDLLPRLARNAASRITTSPVGILYE